MMFAPVPGAITLGFILGDLTAWLIPPARRTLDAEADPGQVSATPCGDLPEYAYGRSPPAFASRSLRLFR